MRLCSVAGCGKKHVARGWCRTHYERWYERGDPSFEYQKRPGLTWLLAHLNHQDDQCLTWPFHRDRNGYGRMRHKGEWILASRVMCLLAHGDPPAPKHETAHICGNGNGGCVNPAHLMWKTRKENQADRIRHGTTNRGERHPFSVFTETDIKNIRSILGRVKNSQIAPLYGVHKNTIGSIKSGRNWAWLK